MNDIALFLDLDNFAIGARHANVQFDINLLLDYLEDDLDGRIVLRRAYGDNRQNHRLLRQLATAGFTIQVNVDVSGYGKNLADMQIVVEAMETLLSTTQYNIYVLITGDRDFSPLVQSLRQHGKTVIGVGIKHTASYSLIHLCDRYIFYKDISAEEELDESQVRELLMRALDDLFQPDVEVVQASVLRQRMSELSNHVFDRTNYGDGSFRQFLSNYPEAVSIKHEDTTTYVYRPEPAEVDSHPLHLKYRTGLKKQRLRIVLPADVRLLIIKDMIAALKQQSEIQWRELLEKIYEHHENQDSVEISKNAINDVLLLARKAQVIRTAKGASLASAPVMLQLNSDKPVKEAVICCDIAYLQSIQNLDEPFDMKEVALALYDSVEHVPYLQAIIKRGEGQ